MATLHTAYLTGRQLRVWDLMRDGLSQSEVARQLKITRQAVNQLAQTIPKRISAALLDAAELNGVRPQHIDGSRGILMGWNNHLQTETVITLNRDAGLRVWYRHNVGRCKTCPTRRQCKSTLLGNLEDLRVSLTQQERRLEPSKLSSLIFSRALGRKDENHLADESGVDT